MRQVGRKTDNSNRGRYHVNQRKEDRLMKRDFLTKLELDTETINQIMAEHGRTVTALNDSHKEALDAAKADVAEKDTKLRELESDLETLESLKVELEETKQQVTDTATELKVTKVERALIEAGAKDLEYAKFKLGDVEVDDLESAIEELKEKIPVQFQASEIKPANNGKLEPPKDRPRKTKDEILAIKNDEERIKEIANNKDLFK